MSGETYAIVFKGEIVEGFVPETVKAQLAKLLKADVKKAAALFSGKQIVLKKTTDRAEAAKYLESLGYTVTTGVSQKTNFLVDEENKVSSKRKKAEQLGIEIVTIKQLEEI